MSRATPRLMITPDKVAPLIRRIHDGTDHLAVDTETTGRDAVDDRIVGLCVATGPKYGVYLPWRMERQGIMGMGNAPRAENLPDNAIHDVVKACHESGRLVAFHGAAFDIPMMEHEGWDPFPRWVDTMIARWLVARGVRPKGGYDLKTCAKRDLKMGRQANLLDIMHPDGFQFTELDRASHYGGGDATKTHRLWTWCDEKITAADELYGNGWRHEYDALERPVIDVVAHMRKAGFLLDADYLRKAHAEVVAEQATLMGEVGELVKGNFPISSPQAISKMMFDDLKWWSPPPGMERNQQDAYSTNKEVLAKQYNGLHRDKRGKRLAWCVLRWRKLDTMRSRYTISLIKHLSSDGRVRCHFAQHGTATGRFSSSGPNLQNIPRPSADHDPRVPDWEKHLPAIRGAFIASPGCRLVGGDFSQVELRLMAHFSKDPTLLEVYTNDGDVHQTTADACECSRQDAKPINFGLIYGEGAKTLAGQIGCNVSKAQRYRTKYFRKYRGVKHFQERTEREVRRDGYVTTITGRHRVIEGIHAKVEWKQWAAVRMAVNTRIQGSAADIMKIAMRNLHRYWRDTGALDNKVRIQLQIHDELLCESEDNFAEEACRDLKREFENAAQLRVPLRCDPSISPVGGNWLDVK